MGLLARLALIITFLMVFSGQELFAAQLLNQKIKVCLAGRVMANLPSYGSSMINAVNLVIADEHLGGRVLVESYFYDNKPLEPVYEYKKMVDNGCSAIIGYEYLSDLILLKNMNSSIEIPIFTSYASTRKGESIKENIFIFMPDYDYLAENMIDFLKGKYSGFDNILLVTDIGREDLKRYKDSYIKIFKKHRIKYEVYDFLERDLKVKSDLLSINSHKQFKYIFLLSGVVGSSAIADALNNKDVVFVGTENFGSYNFQSFHDLIKNKNIKAHFIRNIDFDGKSHALSSFESDYFKKFGENPSLLSAYTYDAMRIITKVYLDHHEVNSKYILQTPYRGITGISINSNGFNRSHSSIVLTNLSGGYIFEKYYQ
jgi:hypothetical protein